MPVSEESFISQVLYPQKLIFTKLLQPVQHEVFKEAMLHVYRQIQENSLEKWVMDSTSSVFTMQDQKWAVEQLGLLLQDTPLKKVAMVRSHDPFLQVVAESMRSKIYAVFGIDKELQHFATLEEALRFLAPDADPVELAEKLNVSS